MRNPPQRLRDNGGGGEGSKRVHGEVWNESHKTLKLTSRASGCSLCGLWAGRGRRPLRSVRLFFALLSVSGPKGQENAPNCISTDLSRIKSLRLNPCKRPLQSFGHWGAPATECKQLLLWVRQSRSRQNDNRNLNDNFLNSIGLGRFTSRSYILLWKGWCVTSLE